MTGLDTDVLVRYLVQDDKAQSVAATRRIEDCLRRVRTGLSRSLCLVEPVWFLESCYRCSRHEVAEPLERLLRVRQFRIQSAEVAWCALRLFSAGKADFADCLIGRIGNAHERANTITFDRNAASLAGMKLLG